MDTNWIIFAFATIGIVILVLFLFWQNMKDQKDVTQSMKDEYKARVKKEEDVNDAEEKK